MSIRRRHGTTNRSITYEDLRSPVTDETSSPSSLAAQAIRASSAHRDSSLSSAYGESAISSACRESSRQKFATSPQDSTSYEYTSMKSSNESKHGFWGVLARKAKAILEDDNVAQEFETPSRNRSQWANTTPARQFSQSYQSPESHRKMDNPSIQKGLDAITSSLNFIGDTIGKSLEEGLTIVENRTNDIIQETRKLNIRRKGSGSSMQNQATDLLSPQDLHQIQTDHETQLKASRDVANAMTAKTKLLMRELKTVKADLAFAKERCAQLEEENKILRESREKGDSPEDDDLIRLQLETLLAEKARLAHENSMYARENRFLREIVEYHQLTMQDVVYLDEGIEEVTEVYPIQFPATTSSQVSAQEVTPSVIQPPLPAPKSAGSLPIPTPPPSAELSPPTSTASGVQQALEVPSQNEEARPRPIKAAGDAKSEPETEGGDCSTID